MCWNLTRWLVLRMLFIVTHYRHCMQTKFKKQKKKQKKQKQKTPIIQVKCYCCLIIFIDLPKCTPECYNGGVCNVYHQCECPDGYYGPGCKQGNSIKGIECNPAEYTRMYSTLLPITFEKQ